LTGVANGNIAPGNGVYKYSSSSTFPTSTYNSADYWVDVMFQPGTGGGSGAPGAPTAVSATPASGQAMVSWLPPANQGSGSITGYTVTPWAGSTPGTPVPVSGSTTSTTVTGLQVGTTYTFTVTASNGSGPGPASAASGPVTPEDTILDFATPTTIDSGDTTAVEVGVKFTSLQAGQIMGIRFYKSALNTGVHVGSLWSTTAEGAGTGTLLASGTFTGESGSGWQTLLFSSPVTVTTGTTYVAGYLAPNGHYSATGNGFASGVDNGPLQAYANSTTPNGVYAYGSTSTFPTNSFGATNYWVDVLFQPSS
jgi:hypothetical protein